MARNHKYKRRRFRNYYPRVHRRIKKGMPSIVQTMGLATPQIMSQFGQSGYGYNAVAPLLAGQWEDGIHKALANEVMLFTGFNTIEGGWSMNGPLLNYGLMLGLPFVLKKIFGSRSVNIPMLGRVKIV